MGRALFSSKFPESIKEELQCLVWCTATHKAVMAWTGNSGFWCGMSLVGQILLVPP